MGHISCHIPELKESDTFFSIYLFDIDELKATLPIMRQVNINGKHLSLQVDTGSSFIMVGYDKYITLKEKYNLGKLKPVIAFPRTYTGEEVKMNGHVTVQVNIDQFSKKLPILVAPCKGPVLFSRDWISEINPNMYNLFQMECEISKNIQSKLDDIFSEYTVIFHNKLGCVENKKGNI